MSAPLNLPDNPEYCPSCHFRFRGSFCYHCGEKRASRKDYSLSKYVTHAVDMFTHFDGKFFTSIKYLLFYPGKLTEENLAGRKVNLMKPVQLFVVISLVYFFLMKDKDIFVTFMQHTNAESPIRKEGVKIAAERNISFEAYQEHYNEVIKTAAKSCTFALIPFFAIGVWVLFFKKVRAIVPSLIFSTHFFSFFLAFVLIYFELILRWLNPQQLSPDQRLIGLSVGLLIVAVYLFFALSRVYKQNVLLTAVKTFALLVWFIFILASYRETMAWVALEIA